MRFIAWKCSMFIHRHAEMLIVMHNVKHGVLVHNVVTITFHGNSASQDKIAHWVTPTRWLCPTLPRRWMRWRWRAGETFGRLGCATTTVDVQSVLLWRGCTGLVIPLGVVLDVTNTSSWQVRVKRLLLARSCNLRWWKNAPPKTRN